MPSQNNIKRLELAAVILAVALVWGPLIKASIIPQKQSYSKDNLYQQTPSEHADTYWPSVIQALSASMMVILVAGQISIALIQNDIAKRQTGIQRAQHFAAHRPRLRVRNVVIHRTRNGNRDETALLFQDHNIVGQCYVSNIGGTSARIVESHLIVFASQMGLPMERPYEGKEPNYPVGQIVIGAGESHPIPFREVNPLVTETGEPGRARGGSHPFFVLGWIYYSDDNNVTRRTAFCRQWNAGKRRFMRLDDDPDYDHEE